ncbi:G5 domain-containing protein [Alloscardovia venturai]|uniref:G5 domain-containing protein n=1 Tax=Alloscardovia venturai TaxID=1769421 RepID=A0ABW2Y4P3_9BIFI
MALRWTPQRFTTLRRWRIAVCIMLSLALTVTTFFVGVRKSVALTVDGKTRHVHTLSLSVDGLLREQRVNVKTHDFVDSSSGSLLKNNSHVVVHTAYEATITIDGKQVGFWTYATSADQLLALFKQNEKNAVKVTVDIKNVYNKLTGGFVINANGPVTVRADGKESIAPDGKQPAAAILDSQGITLDKDDRVSVEQDSNTTVLRITRITYTQSTREVAIPFSTRTINDDTLDEGTRVVDQQGVTGITTQYLKNTVADGHVESSEITKEIVTRDPQDEVIRIGTKKKEEPQASGASAEKNNSTSSDQNSTAQKNDQSQSQTDTQSQSSQNQSQTDKQAKAAQEAQKKAAAEAAAAAAQAEAQKRAAEQKAAQERAQAQARAAQQAQQQAQVQTGLWHPTVAQAKAYAQAAAAQYGWTGSNWSAIEWLWNRESSWRWNAQNSSSGAYGIPQALPGDKMSVYGANWRDDASIQINWGLNYIKQRYGTPLAAQAHSKSTGWY